MNSHAEDLANLAAEMGRETPHGTPPSKDFGSLQRSLLDLSASVADLRKEVAGLPTQIRKQAKADAATIADSKTKAMATALVDGLTDAVQDGDGQLKTALKELRSDLTADLALVKNAAAQSQTHAVSLISSFISHTCNSNEEY